MSKLRRLFIICVATLGFLVTPERFHFVEILFGLIAFAALVGQE